MSSTRTKTIDAYLGDLCASFRNVYQEDRRAWGQFLDSPGEHPQTGPYGTSAGAMVMAFSGHGGDVTARAVSGTLREWGDQQSEESQDYVAQTLRLSMLMVALSSVATDGDVDDAVSIQIRLLDQRLVSSGLWGNYWVDGNVHDEECSVFVSSIVLLSFSAVELNEQQRLQLPECRQKLEDVYFKDPERHAAYAPVVFLALNVFSDGKISRRLAREMRMYSREPIDLATRYIYFYDYRGANANWKREYFIVPTDLFCAMSIDRNTVPSGYRLRASSVLDQLKDNIDANNGVFNPESTGRVSALEQAFTALALVALKRSDESGSVISSPEKLWFKLLKSRPESEIWRRTLFVLYVVLYLELLILISWPVFSDFSFTPKQNLVIATSIYIASRMRDPVKLIRQIFGVTQ